MKPLSHSRPAPLIVSHLNDQVGSTARKQATPGRANNRQDLVDATLWIVDHTDIVPCFYGPTASGKTWLAKVVAEQLEAKLIVVLLQQFTPDEVCGFQVILDGVLVAQPPYLFH